MWLKMLWVLSIAILLIGCNVHKPIEGLISVPNDQGHECQSICSQMGLALGAVVIIRNSAGCVCEPEKSPAKAKTGGSAAIAGGAMAVIQEEENQRAMQTTSQSPIRR